MTVWNGVVGQPEVVGVLREAARAAAGVVEGRRAGSGAMTHAWLFTGPPGSSRSEAARAFAAALLCPEVGCGHCQACHTVLAGTNTDAKIVVPEGLSISVREMRELVQAAARRPSSGRWRVVVIEDANRLTEGASNALLKAVEEPPSRTVFLLCAPSDHPHDVSVTIRSRCRVVALRTPEADAISAALSGEGVDAETAGWAASVCGGHLGRARRLAADPEVRVRREAVLAIPLGLRGPGDIFARADDLVKAAESEAAALALSRDEPERDELRTALGAGGTGKGTATATRGTAGAIKELERRQKSRATRTQRDTYDLALVDLAGFYRDVLVTIAGSSARLNHPDRVDDIGQAAGSWTAASTLRRLEAVLSCRDALDRNVKPRIAVEAMLATLLHG